MGYSKLSVDTWSIQPTIFHRDSPRYGFYEFEYGLHWPERGVERERRGTVGVVHARIIN